MRLAWSYAVGKAMRRRDFIKGIIGSAASWPLVARAQQPGRMRLIGVLMGYAESDRVAQTWLAAFRAALPKLGWTEGSNLRIELRWSADDADRMRTLAKELVDRGSFNRKYQVARAATFVTEAMTNESR